MWVQVSGMKKLEAAIHPGNYNTLWIAGQSVELINDIAPCKVIIERMKEETLEAYRDLGKVVS